MQYNLCWEHKYSDTFHVLRGDVPLILGMQFLRTCTPCIDWKNTRITCFKNKKKLIYYLLVTLVCEMIIVSPTYLLITRKPCQGLSRYCLILVLQLAKTFRKIPIITKNSNNQKLATSAQKTKLQLIQIITVNLALNNKKDVYNVV